MSPPSRDTLLSHAPERTGYKKNSRGYSNDPGVLSAAAKCLFMALRTAHKLAAAGEDFPTEHENEGESRNGGGDYPELDGGVAPLSSPQRDRSCSI